MAAHVLTLNAGSSSVKFALFPFDVAAAAEAALPRAHWSGQAEGLGAGLQAQLQVRDAQGALRHEAALTGVQSSHAGALAALLDWLRQEMDGESAQVAAVGHRIVHGGPDFAAPCPLDAATLAALDALNPLAPLHQPHNLAGVRAAMAAFDGVPQIACFDTAFYAAQPAVNARFAVPQALHEAGVRRYGFHGLSYESIVAQLGHAAPALAGGRVVVAHLGNGASMCAIGGGRAVATTMSFSPLDGLAMGTRCGQLDAAVVLYLQRTLGMDVAAVEQLLFRQSGLLGMSGLSSDMRTLQASDAPAAADAVTYFCEQVVQQLGRLAAALRGLDGVVFTGGIGQNAADLRARILADCGWLGLQLDEAANRTRGAARISAAGSAVQAWVLPTDEEAVIARHTARMAGAG